MFFGGDLIHRQHPHGGGVDRHRRVHLAERDVLEQATHRAEVWNRHADLAHFAPRQDVIRVVAGLRRQVECHRETGLAFREVLAIQSVRFRRRTVTGVRAHHP